MPINAIVAEVDERGNSDDGSDAPEIEEPSDQPAETSMRTPDMMPPYLHIQTVNTGRTLYGGMSVTLGIIGVIRWFENGN